MIIINVLLDVKADKRKEFLGFMADMVEKSRAESGCIFYTLFEEVEAENQFAIIEKWQDQKAVDQHNETMHFQSFVDKINDYLMKDFDIVVSQSTE